MEQMDSSHDSDDTVYIIIICVILLINEKERLSVVSLGVALRMSKIIKICVVVVKFVRLAVRFCEVYNPT